MKSTVWEYFISIALASPQAAWYIGNAELEKAAMPVYASAWLQSFFGNIMAISLCYANGPEGYSFFSTSMETGGLGLFRGEQALIMWGAYGPCAAYLTVIAPMVCL